MVSKVRVAAVAGSQEPDGALGRVLAGYRRYLRFERGVCGATADCYEPRARRFLSRGEKLEGLGLDELTAADVSGCLAHECPLRGAGEARLLVVVVRSVLRYLHEAGLIASPLEWAVPAVAAIGDRSLPRALEPEVVAALLSSCDRSRTVGLRDYAILLLLARLGLRASEVGRICLDDVNWRSGEILIHGKGGREDLLPLPTDVGEALADYLRRRPPGPEGCRVLFLKVIPPVGPMSRSAVSAVVREACSRIGIPRVCPHRLRHTAASRMLQAGASLEEIGQVLRHRERRTTAIYARVDRSALRAIAQPWPEVAP